MRWSHPFKRLVQGRDRSSGRLVQARGWPKRHWIVSSASLSAVVLVAAVVPAALSEPPAPCGPGMTKAGTVCVGLDVDSTGFVEDSPIADFSRELARANDAITGSFATIVLIDNMTPDPAQDSDGIRTLRHRIQGTLTAVRRANTQAIAGGTEPKIKLLLANYGSRADSWRQAVGAIKKWRASEGIAAVTGIGMSLETTRQAIASLSEAGIAVVGSVITADDMNTDLEGNHITNFVRVAPTNTDQARAMVSYILDHGYQRAMLIHDLNEGDNYSRTLASGISAAYEARTGGKIEYTDPYRSPKQNLNGTERDQYMKNRFTRMLTDICVNRPDVIVFAGRAVDLTSFMRALSEGGACHISTLDVVTGDDAVQIVGEPLPSSGHLRFRVFYSALAHGAQWDSEPPDSNNRRNFDGFAQEFVKGRFSRDDLDDGHAMMNYDAALTAITAIRQNPLASSDPSTVSDYLLGFRCTNVIPGASGIIALQQDGNPTNKAMPILQIQPDGSLTQEGFAWPAGTPLDPLTTCG